MKMNIISILKNKLVAVAATGLVLASCNKGFDEIPAPTPAAASNQNLAEKLNVDPNYSLFRDALIKYNLYSRLGNPDSRFTILGLDNATLTAVLASQGLTPAQFLALPAGQPTALAPVFQYHVIPQSVPAANLANAFSAATSIFQAQIPNGVYPSSLQIGSTSGLPVMMNACLGKNGPNAFANNVPIAGPDAVIGNNGVLHRLATVAMPPSLLLKNQVDTAVNTLSYFKAAITRADSGQVGTGKIDELLNTSVINLTVFAPTDAAFRATLTGLIAQALIAQGVPAATALATATSLAATPAVFSNPALFSVLTPATVRGILYYHILGTNHRAFSVNLPLTTTTIKTLLNSGVPSHPGLVVDRALAAPRLLGAANGAGNFANFVAVDRNAINGVLHVIDRVLIPQ